MTGIIIQARMGSTRLPNKVMKPIAGKSLLERLILRLKASKQVKFVAVATTVNPVDDAIADLAENLKVPHFRGSEKDVLNRFYMAAKEFGLANIVRITADCPLMDAGVLDAVVRAYKTQKFGVDYVSNVCPPTYPDGMDVEIFSFAALERAWKDAVLPSEREHVTSYIVNNPDMFRIKNVAYKTDLSKLRLTVDNEEDLKVVRKIHEILGRRNKNFGVREIEELYKDQPEIFAANSHLARNEGYAKSVVEDGSKQ